MDNLSMAPSALPESPAPNSTKRPVYFVELEVYPLSIGVGTGEPDCLHQRVCLSTGRCVHPGTRRIQRRAQRRVALREFCTPPERAGGAESYRSAARASRILRTRMSCSPSGASSLLPVRAGTRHLVKPSRRTSLSRWPRAFTERSSPVRPTSPCLLYTSDAADEL